MSKRSARKGSDADDKVLEELDQRREENQYKSNLIGIGVAILLVAFLLTSGLSCTTSSGGGTNSGESAGTDMASSPLDEVSAQIAQWKESAQADETDIEAWSNLGYFELQKVQAIDGEIATKDSEIQELEKQQLEIPVDEDEPKAEESESQQNSSEADPGEAKDAEETVDLKELEQNLVQLQTERAELEEERTKTLEDSELHLSRALKLDPDFGFALRSKAQLELYLEDYPAARETFIALRAAGEKPVPEDEQFKDAAEAERVSMQADAYLGLAQVADANDDSAVMIKHLEKAKELAPGDFRAYAGLIQAYLAEGNRPLAMENYKHLKGIAMNGGDQQAQMIAQIIGMQTGLEAELNPPPPPEPEASEESDSAEKTE